MVRGIGHMGLPGMGLAGLAALALAGRVYRVSDGDGVVTRKPTQHDAHMWTWDAFLRAERRRLEHLEYLRAEAEKGRPYIDAAQEKRNRKNAKRRQA